MLFVVPVAQWKWKTRARTTTTTTTTRVLSKIKLLVFSALCSHATPTCPLPGPTDCLCFPVWLSQLLRAHLQQINLTKFNLPDVDVDVDATPITGAGTRAEDAAGAGAAAVAVADCRQLQGEALPPRSGDGGVLRY